MVVLVVVLVVVNGSRWVAEWLVAVGYLAQVLVHGSWWLVGGGFRLKPNLCSTCWEGPRRFLARLWVWKVASTELLGGVNCSSAGGYQVNPPQLSPMWARQRCWGTLY